MHICITSLVQNQGRGKWYSCCRLTHWGRVTHICVSKLTIIGSDNGLSPDRPQAIIRTNAGILLIGPLGTNFSEISNKILTFSFKEMRLKVSSAKWRPFCLGFNVLTYCSPGTPNVITELGQHWLKQWLVADGTKPLPKPMLTYQQWGLGACTSGQFHRKYLQKSIFDMNFNLRLQLYFPGVNELICIKWHFMESWWSRFQNNNLALYNR